MAVRHKPRAAPRPPSPGEISARLHRLPATRHVWMVVCLLSLGGFFEFYDLFFTGYVAPGLFREGILTPTTPGLFGTSGIAGFIASLFAGLVIGTMVVVMLAVGLMGPRTRDLSLKEISH